MSNDVVRTFRSQADRAPADPDDLQMLADVHRRVAERGRRRKVLMGGGAGSAVVAGVVIATLVIGNDVTSGARGKHEAGTAPTGTTAVVSTVAPRATKPPLSPPPTGAALVRIAAAPKKAPLSLGLMPKGWIYVGENAATTAYGPAGSKRGNRQAGDFTGKIVAEVGLRYAGEKFSTTVAGHPARIYLTTENPSIWIVDIAYNAKILLTVQVWRNAMLSRGQVLRMANTLAVRNVSHPAQG